MGFLSLLLDALFPRFCLDCKSEGSLLCSSCKEGFSDFLSYKGGPHAASFAYGNPVVRNLIKAWKYDFDHSAFLTIEGLAIRKIESLLSHIPKDAVIVALPLSDRRLLERGFNQADQIARMVEQHLGLSRANILKRSHRSGHQAERTEEERKTAMADSPFTFSAKTIPKQVLLVDDVWTTGATLTAAEKVLRAAGVEEVYFYTLAQGG